MDWLSTIVGAVIGFVSSMGIIIVQRLLDRAGKIEIYSYANEGSYSLSLGGAEIKKMDCLFFSKQVQIFRLLMRSC